MRRSLAALALVGAVAGAGFTTGQASAAEVPSPPATAHRETATSFIGVVTTAAVRAGLHQRFGVLDLPVEERDGVLLLRARAIALAPGGWRTSE
ncbi:hypothetical protein [Pseudonocardia alni]|uniref:hypothetical protein n=1 Tax=Pseudonocardia alni TaxID=33907 RepID=UPI00332DB663